MDKAIFTVLLICGVILIIYGLKASDSVGSDFSRFFTGSPTDEAMWLVVGGAAASIIGAVGLMRGEK